MDGMADKQLYFVFLNFIRIIHFLQTHEYYMYNKLLNQYQINQTYLIIMISQL